MDFGPIKQRLANATPGPWRRGATVQRTIYKGLGPDDLIGLFDSKDDAYFVTKARTDVELLIALVEHYEAAVTRIAERSREADRQDIAEIAQRALDSAPRGPL